MADAQTPQAQYELPEGTGNNPQEDYNENWESADHAGGWLTAEIATGEGGVVGEWYTFNATGKAVKAQADSLDNCAIVFMLTEDTLEGEEGLFLKAGNWYKSSWGLDPSKIYYLDQSTAGAWTTTQPASGLIIVLGRCDEDTETFHIAEGGGGGGGGLNDHATLTNLPWSVAGHTMDTDLDMLLNGIVNVEKITIIPDGTAGSNVGLYIGNTSFVMHPSFNYYSWQDIIHKASGATTGANRMVGIEREYRMTDAVNPIGIMQGTNNVFRAWENMGDSATVFIGHKNLYDVAAGVTADGDAYGYWNKWLFNGAGSTIRNLHGFINDFYTVYSVLGSIYGTNNIFTNAGLGTVAGDVFANTVSLAYTGVTPIGGDMHAYHSTSNSTAQTGTRYSHSVWGAGWDYAFYSDEDTVPSYLAGQLQVDNTIWSEGTTGATPTSGAGTRLMWIPSKEAFRGGTIHDSSWDDANIGQGSFCFSNYRSSATGAKSTVFGHNCGASGTYAVAMGYYAYSSGTGSIALGSTVSATALNAVAIGSNITAITDAKCFGDGIYSFTEGLCLGWNIDTNVTYRAVFVGRNITGGTGTRNDDVAFGRYITFDTHDSAMVVGMGAGASNPLLSQGDLTFAIGYYSNLPSIVLDGSGAGVGVRADVLIYADTTISGASVFTGGISAPLTGSGTNSEAWGAGSTATGNNSLAVGYNCTASGDGVVCVGNDVVASNGNSYLFGYQLNTSGVENVLVGRLIDIGGANGTVVVGDYVTGISGSVVAIGSDLLTGGGASTYSVLIGTAGVHTGTIANNVAIGYSFNIAGDENVAIGEDVSVTGSYSVGIGQNSNVAYNYGVALGRDATITGVSGTAIGEGSSAGINSVSLGRDAFSSYDESIAIGRSAVTTAVNQLMIGATSYEIDTVTFIVSGTEVSFTNGVVFTGHVSGRPTGTGANSEVFGVGSSCTATNGVVVGNGSALTGNNSVVIGYLIPAPNVNYDCVIIGSQATVTHSGSVAIGAGASVTTQGVAIGDNASSGSNAIAIGQNANGAGGLAIGRNSLITGGGGGIAIGAGAVGYVSGIAIGTGATTNTKAESIAIGTNATAQVANGMVIGATSYEIDTLTFITSGTALSATNIWNFKDDVWLDNDKDLIFDGGTGNQKIVAPSGVGSLEFYGGGSGGKAFEIITDIGYLGNKVAYVYDVEMGASTILQVLGTLEFGTVGSGTGHIKWNKHTANSVTLNNGTSSSVVADLQTANDGNVYAVQEATGSPAIQLIVDFTSVGAFQWVDIRCQYEGSVIHNVDIELYNWTSTNWDKFNNVNSGFSNSGTSFINFSFFVGETYTNYVGTGGSAGQVLVRFNHSVSGNVSHDLYIDVVALYQ